MGLFDKLKKTAAEKLAAAVTPAVPVRLPEARPGKRCPGGAYFEDTTGRIPLGRAEITIALERNDNFTPPRQVATVYWNGRQIGWMDGLSETPYTDVLKRHGQAFTAAAEITTETVVELADGSVHTPHIVRALVPAPDLLEAWFKASPAERASMKLDTVTAKAPLKESNQHQEALHALHRKHGEKPFPARIETAPEPSGKYKGQDSLTFTAGGQTLGRIPARYREQHQDVFDAVLAGARDCQVAIRVSGFGEDALYAVATVSA
ncbi:hypothetical protein [Sinomonas atrocyanea]